MLTKTTFLPPHVKMAVSPLSWTNDVLEDLGNEITLEACLEEAAGAGYQGVELGRKFPRDAAVLRPLLEPYGLALASGWHSGNLSETTVADETANVAAHAALLRDMGCDVLVYGEVGMMAPGAPLDVAMSARRLMPKTDIPAYAARLTEFSKYLRNEFGLRLAYHHHLMMVAETFDEISAIFDRTGPETGLLLDTGHAVAAGFDYRHMIERFGDRIVHIHLKDVRDPVMGAVRRDDLSFNAGVRAGMFTVPGDGVVDFGPLTQFVRDSGYRGWLVVEAEQDPAKAPPRPAVTRAYLHMLDTFTA